MKHLQVSSGRRVRGGSDWDPASIGFLSGSNGRMVSRVQTLGVGDQFSTPPQRQVGRVILEVGRGHILPPPECFGLCLLFTTRAVQLHSIAVPQFHQDRKTSKNHDRRTAGEMWKEVGRKGRSMHCLL